MIVPAVESTLIPTDDGHPVGTDLYAPAGVEALGVVILVHGFKGHKRWGFYPYLAERLREAGMAALAVDLSHNGTFPAPEGTQRRYPRPDLFERNTLRREYDDLGCVINYVEAGSLGIHGPLGLFGHSRGAVGAILQAIEHPTVRALCTWSSTDDPDFHTPAQKEAWRRDGRLAFADTQSGEHLAIGIAYLDDLEQRHATYHLAERVRELRMPHLTVHGRQDLVIPVQSATMLYEAESQLEHRRLLLLDTGHTFGIPPESAPLDVPPKALVRAVDETVAWFARFLPQGGAD